MGLFSRKRRMSTQEWCEDFYYKGVFGEPIGDVQLWRVFGEASHRTLQRYDPSFSAVDVMSLSVELLALHLEVIGIAWLFRVKDDLWPVQSEFTRLYLLKHDCNPLWDRMEPYNQAVAKSAVGGSDPATGKGRANITFMNTMRADLFDKWFEESPQAEAEARAKAVARAANRFGSNVSWKSNMAHNYLSFALTDQLQCDVTKEARTGMMAIIQGFFDGAIQELKKVKITS